MKFDKKSFTWIIFDFDGVIADTEQSRIDILSEILPIYDISTEYLNLENIKGIRTKQFLIRYYPELLSKTINKIIKLRHKEYLLNLKKYCKPFQDETLVIKKLYEHNFKIALATNNSTKNSHFLLEYLNLSKYFSKVFGCEKIENPVNGEKDYSKVINLLKTQVEKCIVIEDSEIGIYLAKKAGLICIKFDNSNNNTINNIADLKASSYIELGRIFEVIKQLNDLELKREEKTMTKLKRITNKKK